MQSKGYEKSGSRWLNVWQVTAVKYFHGIEDFFSNAEFLSIDIKTSRDSRLCIVAQASLLAFAVEDRKKFQIVPVRHNHKLEACATVTQASLLAFAVEDRKKFQIVPVRHNHKLEACATLKACATELPLLRRLPSVQNNSKLLRFFKPPVFFKALN